MRLIIGLGNPGAKYELTRHNAGQMALDRIVAMHGLEETASRQPAIIYKGEIGSGCAQGLRRDSDTGKAGKVIAMKPKTFMNECGPACASVAAFYKVDPAKIIVLQDDLDMELGKIRLKINGGDGGHNGIKSINCFIKNEYIKIKIGIGRSAAVGAVGAGEDDQERQSSVHSHVLSNFTEAELTILCQSLDNLAKAFEYVMLGDLEKFGSVVNERNKK